MGAIRSELLKVFTTRLWWGMALGMGALAAAIAAGFAALVGTDFGQDPGSGANPFAQLSVGTAQMIYNAGLVQSLTALFPLALGVLLITSEYRHKTITATLLAVPNRWSVMASKSVAVITVGFLFAVVHALASVIGGAGVLAGAKGLDTMLGNGEVLKSLAIGIIAMIVWTLLGFGFGMLVPNQIAATLIAVGFAFIGQIALNILFAAQEWTTAAKFLPGNLTAGMLITADPTMGTGNAAASPYFTHWWVSALVLVGYAAALAVAGALITSRRDVS